MKKLLCLFLISFLGMEIVFGQEPTVIDSIKLVIKNAKHDTIIIKAWQSWDYFLPINDLENSLKLNHKIDSVCNLHISPANENQINFYTKAKAESYNSLGLLMTNQGELDKAIHYFNICLELRKKMNDRMGVGGALSNLGNIYYRQGNTDKAISVIGQSLKIAEELGDKMEMIYPLNSIGQIYNESGEYEMAIKYYKKCLKLCKETNFEVGIAAITINLGSCYQNNKQYEKAIEYFEEGIVLSKKIDNKTYWANALNNIGTITKEKGDFDKAMEYYLNALQLREEVGDKEGLASTLANMGYLKFKKGDTYSGIQDLKKAYDLAMEINAIYTIRDASEYLKEVYQSIGNFADALFYYEAFITAKDSLESENNKNELIRHEFKYAYEKQAAEDSVKTAEEKKVRDAQIAQQDAEIKAKNNMQYMLFGGLALVIVFAGFMYNRFKITQKQKGIIEEQKHIVEEKHKEITDSINYAERIQRSFLASKELLDENLSPSGGDGVSLSNSGEGGGYFVYFQPKDVVSGDFYFASQLNNENFAYACADSTGHGVPGAIMSILNISSLEKSIELKTEPADILNETRKIIIERLKKDGSAEGGKDGMDCSLIVLNKEKNKLTYSAANNPIWVIRLSTSSGTKFDLIELKPDKMPVGKHDRDQTPFTQNEFELQKGDLIYTLTDGMPDQFGGPKAKKYKYTKLKEFLISIAGLPMETQHQKLQEEFENWKGYLEQVDDVCIIGVRI